MKEEVVQIATSTVLKFKTGSGPNATQLMKWSIDGSKVFTHFHPTTNTKKVVPIINFGILPTPQPFY